MQLQDMASTPYEFSLAGERDVRLTGRGLILPVASPSGRYASACSHNGSPPHPAGALSSSCEAEGAKCSSVT